MPSLVDDVGPVVSTTPLPKDLAKPSITSLAFLTGIGRDAVIAQIAGHLTP